MSDDPVGTDPITGELLSFHEKKKAFGSTREGIYLYKNGIWIFVSDLNYFMLWKDIIGVTSSIVITKAYFVVPIDTNVHCALRWKDGGVRVIPTNCTTIVECIQTILRETFQHTLNYSIERLNRDRAADFGSLRLTFEGIHYKGSKFLPWGEVRGVTIDKGSIGIISRRKWWPWKMVNVGNVENFQALLVLANKMAAAEG